jgi:hypothetical protein
VALAGRVIASHYAEQVERVVATAAGLRGAPSDDAPEIDRLMPDDAFAMVDESIGWAWGYAGKERRVGYVRTEVLAVQ